MLNKIDEFLQHPWAQKFLFFNEMLTPSLIRLAYWLGLLAVLWNGLQLMFSGGFIHFIEGILFIIIYALLARIIAELIMVLFKLNEKMGELVENTSVAPTMTVSNSRKTGKKTTKRGSKKTTKKL